MSSSAAFGSILALETTMRVLLSGISQWYADGRDGDDDPGAARHRLRFVRSTREVVEEVIRDGVTLSVTAGPYLDPDEMMDSAQASIAMVFRRLEQELGAE